MEVYKYLGLLFDEFVTFEEAVKVLSDSAGRALGGIIAKFKHVRDIGYKTYTKLYDCGVSPILHYAGEVWGFKDKSPCNKIQNRAIRVFLGGGGLIVSVLMQGCKGIWVDRLRWYVEISL